MSWVDDSFAGNDGDPADPDKWLDASTNGWKISSNRISNVCDDWEALRSVYMLVGNFDVQIDFDFSNMMSVTDHYLRLYVRTGDNAIQFFVGQVYSSGRKYTSNYYESAWGTQQFSATSATSGKFRIVRSGNNINVYYWSGSAWTSIQNRTFASAPNLYVSLNHASPSGSATAYFDNFVVNSGQVSMSLNLSAAPKLYLRAHDGLEFRGMQMLLGTVSGLILTGMQLLLSSVAMRLPSIPICLSAARHKFKGVNVICHATNAEVIKHITLSLAATDGMVFHLFKMELRTIKATPAFRSVTAHRVNSVISEI